MMNYPYAYTTEKKILSLDELAIEIERRRATGQKIVATNGCFDLLHPGHISALEEAASLGDLLIVGLNSDSSVTRLKGPGKPLIAEQDRAYLLASLRCVNYVIVFNDIDANGWLARVRPHIYCKSGDYSPESLPETDVVVRNGGQVHILPFRKEFSTSALVSKMMLVSNTDDVKQIPKAETTIEKLLAGSNVLRQTAYYLASKVQQTVDELNTVFRNGGKILICGNGGNAANAQHFAAELIGQYQRGQQGFPVLALTTDPSIITDISKDYGFEQVFARQIQTFGCSGDVLIALTTSGYSPNIMAAARQAHSMGMRVIALTGEACSSVLDEVSDIILSVPSQRSPHIQQAHLSILHLLTDMIRL
ncbi:MAG TPA: SIS domain-containing protein [Armatimonadota bacterium]|nr:SIS domain-containing protein [Armatimonadota bacterium]